MATANRRRDQTSGFTWLDLVERLTTEEFQEICALGWRWSGYREELYTNAIVPRYPAWLEVTDGGTVAYAAERAGRLAARAAKHEETGEALLDKAHRQAAIIPFGQPILYGHKSAPGDIRYRDKIHKTFGAGFGELDEAKRLKQAAVSSARHQERQHDVGVIARRIQRLRAEHYPAEVIAAAEAELAAQGGLPIDQLDIQPGDYVYTGRDYCKVVRVGSKNLTCHYLNSPFFLRAHPKGYPLGREQVLRRMTEAEIEQYKDVTR